jgi:prophage regulatory protein
MRPQLIDTQDPQPGGAEKKRRPTVRPPLPEAHADAALLDISDVCALARMSPSWWYDEVRAGRAPAPLRFGPRCTRWKLADVRAWLIERAAQPQAEAAALVTARAKKAGDKAAENRAARAATVAAGQ